MPENKKGGKFEFGTVVGLVLGFLSVFGSFALEGGKLGALILLPAMIVVFGGTSGAAMIGTPSEIFLKLPKLISLAFFPPKIDVEGTIGTIADCAAIVRKEGLLALENKMGNVKHPFLKKLTMLAVDGISPEEIREIAEVEINYIAERHNLNAALFSKMGGYSPTMGIIGTVLGLIQTLANAGENSNELIRHIATAFIATLWGVFMANIVWLPISDRLKAIHHEEGLCLDIMLEGALSIQAGKSPSLTKTRLYAMLPASKQKAEEK